MQKHVTPVDLRCPNVYGSPFRALGLGKIMISTNYINKSAISKWLSLAFGLALLMAAPGCFVSVDRDHESGEDRNKEQPVTVEVIDVERGAIERVIKASTNLEAESSVPVYARTVNQVKEILAQEGDLVPKGEVLMTMVDDIQRTQADKAEAQLIKAQREYTRMKALFEQDLVSEQDYQNAELDRRQYELAYEDARRDLEYTSVTAPIAGTVTMRNAKVGDCVGSRRDESALLYQVVDFNSMIANLHLPEKHLSELALDQKALVRAQSLGGEATEGYVMRISPIVDPKTGTIRVTIGFKEVGKLRPGMYVDVDLITYVNPAAILVPKEALVYDADQIFAFRMIPGMEIGERRVEQVLIEPQLVDRYNVEPAGNIAAGDQLVVAGKTGLKDNGLVRYPTDPKPEEKNENH